MSRLNYQHLYYFWHVAKLGSISRASEKLHLAQPTISGQLAVFERTIGDKLYFVQGRKLILSATGRTVFRFAEEIFTLGEELNRTLSGRLAHPGSRLNVGVADALPKLVAYRLLEPALKIAEPVQLICHEDKAERLIGEMSAQGHDIVLADIPAMPSIGSRLFNHLLGESEVAVYGAEALAARYRDNFPASLNGAPVLLPTPNTALRRSLDLWFDSTGLCPAVKGEIEDSALLKIFATAGIGLFVAPQAVKMEIEKQYGCRLVGKIDAITEKFYAITTQRQRQHPAVNAILIHAGERLFV